MKYFVIADHDTVLGFRHAGVQGQAVHSADQARSALAQQVAERKAAIIILTDDIAHVIADEVNRLRFESSTPLVVQIPGPQGPDPKRPDLEALIREAMGVML